MMKVSRQIALIIAISAAANISLIFIPQDSSIAQELKQKKKLPPPPPPPSRGVPGNRSVSGSMSGNDCELNLIALAPQFDQNSAGQIYERSVWGKTIAAHPTLWFFVPATPASTKIEFSIQDGEEDIYRVSIPTPQQPGIIGIKIPSTQPGLQFDRNYHWTLKAKTCDRTATINRVHVHGWIARVKLSESIVRQNTTEIYIDNGIWYDAVTSLAQQRLAKPKDLRLLQDWSDLLESANLQAISTQSLN